jgi:hypothetical protein
MPPRGEKMNAIKTIKNPAAIKSMSIIRGVPEFANIRDTIQAAAYKKSDLPDLPDDRTDCMMAANNMRYYVEQLDPPKSIKTLADKGASFVSYEDESVLAFFDGKPIRNDPTWTRAERQYLTALMLANGCRHDERGLIVAK